MSLYLVALVLQNLLTGTVDILKQEDLDILGVERLEVFGCAASRNGPAKTGGEGKGRGRRG